MERLKGKVAIVTGAAMGNGNGIANVLAKYGVKVNLFDISDEVFSAADEINNKGYSASAYKVDITDYKSVKECVDDVYNKNNAIDILVNNAGIARLIDINEMDDKLRDFHFNVNINGMWNCTKAVIKYMMEKKYGKIVNMSSVTGPTVVDPGMIGYATSKAAIIGFTKALAIDLAKYNINANAIMPGYILTPMVKHTAHETNPNNPQEVIDKIASTIPMGKLGTPEDIGNLATFLASDMSSYITGAQIIIDGGSTLPETTSVGRK